MGSSFKVQHLNISRLAEKETPTEADFSIIEDAEDGNKKKKVKYKGGGGSSESVIKNITGNYSQLP